MVSLIDLALHTTVADPPLMHNFAVQIDSIATVQMWSTVDGLALTIASAGARPGSASPTGGPSQANRRSTSGTPSGGGKLTLTRPLGPASQHIYDWVNKANTAPPTAAHTVTATTPGQNRTTSGCVILIDSTSLMMYEWDLTGITPSSWKVSKLDASQDKTSVVMETLELNFTGITFSVSLIH
jgi:phage tail-like protein